MAGDGRGNCPGQGGRDTRRRQHRAIEQLDVLRRNQPELFARATATAPFGYPDGVGAEQCVHPGQRPLCPLVGLGLAAPEPELATTCRDDFVGREHQSGEPTGRPGGDRGVQPTVELPAHPIGNGADRQRAFVAPQPRDAFTVFALDIDRQS